ncbi:kinase [Thraustotheca clavata]|uniref:Kinase n=1 Tax=Thraustotheca clavata TaxID=74557 RepID=A0A1W0A2V3_9STRA|nr:kinase [Thraustotheca clavata]
MERYAIERVLAPALYGDVVLAKDIRNNEYVAIKRMKLEAARRQKMLVGNKAISEDIMFEKHVNQILSADGGNDYVLKMRQDFVQDGYEHFVFDYCPGGELYDVVSNSPDQRLSLEKAKRYFRQIVKGTQFIHSRGFGHRDLSLENVLIDANDNCHICDFGLAASIPSLKKDPVGKAFYMAPEVLSGISYNPAKADTWSLGVMLFIMIAGIPPVEIASVSDSRYRVIRTKGVGKLLSLWKLSHLFDAEALDLLELTFKTEGRISVDDIANHPFVYDPVDDVQLQINDMKLSHDNEMKSNNNNNGSHCRLEKCHFCFDMDKYTIVKKLANAIYGQVLLCKDNNTGNYVAIKQNRLDAMAIHRSIGKNRKVQEDGAMEKAVYDAIAQHGKHSNILHLIETFTDEVHDCMVFEWCNHGELYHTLVQSKRFSCQEAKVYFRQIVLAVHFLHECGYAHRDISLENILLDGNHECRLMDFGLAVPLGILRSERVGKAFYMAPEVLDGTPYNPLQADLWSLGILLFIMITGAPPFERACKDDERYCALYTKGIQSLLNLWHLTPLFSSDAFDVVNGLLQVSPTERMTTTSLLLHPFLDKDVDQHHDKVKSNFGFATLISLVNKGHPALYHMK